MPVLMGVTDWMIVSYKNVHVEASLIPSVMLELSWIELGPSQEEAKELAFSIMWRYNKKWAVHTLGEGPHQNMCTLAPWSWTSIFQNRAKETSVVCKSLNLWYFVTEAQTGSNNGWLISTVSPIWIGSCSHLSLLPPNYFILLIGITAVFTRIWEMTTYKTTFLNLQSTRTSSENQCLWLPRTQNPVSHRKSFSAALKSYNTETGWLGGLSPHSAVRLGGGVAALQSICSPSVKWSSVSIFLGSESLVSGQKGIRKLFKPQTTYLMEIAN